MAADSWLAGFLARKQYPQALAFAAGALRGLAEIERPTKAQRQIAKDAAREILDHLAALEKEAPQ